ncbi:hypothetical protein [Trueperella pecoris]|uniref:hypothetical protein n=1 Tax=Trueperella pecoris TaxID=2733571 RepID=UPI001ABE65A1|nr:hypothetical protein [Trueperella pecoris]QTG75339.1 hypothetical protein J4179_09045 [Trueperella pecoris]
MMETHARVDEVGGRLESWSWHLRDRGGLVMFRPDTRALTVYCWADGSGFGWKSPGAVIFPQTGYFGESPFFTVDVDIDGKIVDVGFALDAAEGRLEHDIECSIDRRYEDEWMIWEIAFPQGSLLTCTEEETWHAVGKLADTLSVTHTPDRETLKMSIRSGKISA